MRNLVGSAIAACLVIGSANAADLKIASWNIANLHHEAGTEVRPGIGTKRTDSDYDLLIEYANSLGRDRVPADIIALQEIGTREGAERIFPSDEYAVFMSNRYDADVAAGSAEDIYTAIAIRKDQGVSIVKQDDLDELSILHDGRPTRAGTALLLDIDGAKLWVLSVHLKSSCATTRSADTSTKDDCETLWKQRVPLLAWINDRRDEGIPFIIAGDFNRRFRQFQDEGPLWNALNNEDLDEPILTKHPETVTRKCATRKGTSTQPIDWIVLDAEIADWFVEGSFWETRFKNDDVRAAGGRRSQRLSDHCPISIQVSF